MRAIGKYIEVWHYLMVLKNSRLNDAVLPFSTRDRLQKSLSEQREFVRYPFRMCFRHRADAVFSQPMFPHSQYMQIIYVQMQDIWISVLPSL